MIKRLMLTFCIALPSMSAFACATCGCSLSTDAATGYSSTAGWRVGVEYDYINQNQLRLGSNKISPAQVAALNDAGGNQEVERNTINRYTTLSLNYASSPDWSFRLQLPYIDRGHTTYGAATNPITPDQISGATVSGLGDIKFITSFQGILPTHNLGLQLGVKVPTGNYGGPSADGSAIVGHKPVAFATGPNAQAAAPDNLLDTSLQAGTGSTDILVGAYYYQAVSQNFDVFVNGQFQAAVRQKLNLAGADYRPGNQANVSFGLRYEANPTLVPQLQVNLSRKGSDQGALADTAGTAGTVAHLSPGLNLSLTQGMQVYAFVQLPVYRKLSGYQLFPHWTATAGLSYTF